MGVAGVATKGSPWGWIIAAVGGVLPWLAEKRPRKKIVAGAKALAKGQIAKGLGSFYGAIGLEHSEPSLKEAFMAIRKKGIAEGILDPVSGMPFEYIAKAAPMPEGQGPAGPAAPAGTASSPRPASPPTSS